MRRPFVLILTAFLAAPAFGQDLAALPDAVALLKGSLWQGNAGRGIVHRSPAVSQPPRILVALDAGW